jgi:hypothetical protein
MKEISPASKENVRLGQEKLHRRGHAALLEFDGSMATMQAISAIAEQH